MTPTRDEAVRAVLGGGSLIEPSIIDAIATAFAPPRTVLVSEHVEGHHMLSSEGSAAPGPWRNAKTPYLVEIMDRLSSHDPATHVYVQAGVQLGKSEIGYRFLGYTMEVVGASVLLVLPTEEVTAKVFTARINPLIRDTPSLRALVAEPRGKDASSTKYTKVYPGGALYGVWANSPTNLRSMPIGRIVFDETDADITDSEEGDFVQLAMARASTFGARKKILATSSPKLLSTSKIHRLFLTGDQRVYMVPCPHCGAEQKLEQSGLRWETVDGNVVPGSAQFECVACKRRIEERWKEQMLPAGRWVPTVKGEPKTFSYHLPSFYSPIGWKSWHDIATQHVTAYRKLQEDRDDGLMRVYVNTIEGRPWDDSDSTSATNHLALMQREGPLELGVVPKFGHLLTAGVDVQDNRLECSIYAWGPKEEAALVNHAIILGDPGTDAPWKALEELLAQQWSTEDGRRLTVAMAAVDSGGHHTHDVYAFAMRHPARVRAIRGANRTNAPPIDRPTQQDVLWRGRTYPKAVWLTAVGQHELKKVLAQRLKFSEPGPGYIHFPKDLDEEFYEQICGEHLVVRTSGRTSRREQWKPIHDGQAVEAWDCLVYAYAAAFMLDIKKIDWDRLAKTTRSAPLAGPHEPAEGVSVRTLASPTTAPAGGRRVRRSPWMSR